MGNAEYAYKVQSFLDEFYIELTYLVNILTKGISVPEEPDNTYNPFPFIIIDDYLIGSISGRFLGEELNKLEKDCKELKRRIPTLPELKSNFHHIIKNIIDISDNYINEYDTNYKRLLELIIEDKKNKPSITIIDTNDFLKTNQFKRLYDICKTTDKILNNHENNSTISELTGFECQLPDIIIKQAYLKLVEKGYIEAKQQHFESIFKPESLPNDFIPVIWKKRSKRNKYINKKSLGDLLRIAEVALNIPKINKLFAHPGGGSINVNHANFFNNKGKDKSEFYNDLSSIFCIK